MKTLQLELTPEKREESLETAAKIIRCGGLVAMPTETVYGLAANALNEMAVESIFKAKGRPQDNPLIVHISGEEMLAPLVTRIPQAAKKCAENFWPGPFTMILPKSSVIPSVVSAGLNTVAVRLPSHPIARELIRRAGVPLAAPSANLSGSPSPTSAEHCVRDLNGRVDAILMGGNSEVGLESTVVSFVGSRPRLLRPGGITAEQLKEVIGEIEIDKAVLQEPEEGEAVASPGMKYKHYSPTARVIMVEGNSEDFVNFVNSKKDEGVFALCYKEDAGALDVPFLTYGSEADFAEQGANLFNALRKLDEIGCRICFAHAPKKGGIGLAVYNRLIRAAGFEVISL